MVTFALGITAPLGSVTCPVNVPEVACAEADGAHKNASIVKAIRMVNRRRARREMLLSGATADDMDSSLRVYWRETDFTECGLDAECSAGGCRLYQNGDNYLIKG